MAPAIVNEIQLPLANQVAETVRQLPWSSYKPEDTVTLRITLAPKTRVEIASVSAIIQFACHLVLSKAVYDVRLDFSTISNKLPFGFPAKSTIRDILFAKHDSSIALNLGNTDCKLTVFRKNDPKERDEWYEQIKSWRKKKGKENDPKDSEGVPHKFHMLLNELVENVSAHAQLSEDEFCFTVGLLFIGRKLCYCVADCGVGLRGSLKDAIITEAKDVAARACALHLTRAQFTSKGIKRGHRGVGLFVTSELATMNKGHLEILSGPQGFEQRDTTMTSVRGIAEWRGTMVHGTINLDHEFNFRHALKLFSEPSNISKDRFLVCQIHLNVYGQRALRTRELCEEIMRDLEIAAERSSKIILDFKEIEEISQAFHGFLERFVDGHKKVHIMIMVPHDADEDLKADLKDLIQLAEDNWVEDESN